MEKEKLKRLVKDEKYIPGIYNYCDRWCERCCYTDKCLSFELSKSQLESNAPFDKKKFWSNLENSFGLVKDMLNEYMIEHGIEPPSEEENEKIESEMKKIDEDINSNPIIVESRIYTKDSGKLLKENDYYSSVLNKVTEEQSAKESLIELQDAIETILFYNSLIFVKLSRVFYSYYSTEFEEEDSVEDDKLISAKIAVVAIERSMAAWHFILEHFDTQSDRVVDIILHLNKIKMGIEKTIPKVLNFKRPYFD